MNLKISKFEFTKENTLFIKGIAILLMLIHHIGLDPTLNLFKDSKYLINFSTQSKVCVSIFLLLSGYGLNESVNNKNIVPNFKNLVLFTINRLLKILKNFWFVFIIFLVIGVSFNLRPLSIYESSIAKNILIDFLGLARFWGTPTYNATWWFLSLLIFLFLLFPTFKLILNYSPFFLLIFVYIFIYFSFPKIHFYAYDHYPLIFCIGMICSQYSILMKLNKISSIRYLNLPILIFFFCFMMFRNNIFIWNYDIINTFTIILIANQIIKIPYISILIIFLGKHSSNIFMTHTFIYYYFFLNFFMLLKKPLFCYLALLLISLMTSLLLEKLKKIHYINFIFRYKI